MAELLEAPPAVELTPDEVERFSRRLREKIKAAGGTDQNAAIHLYTHERACPEARSARGRGCPMTRGRGSARRISAVSARADSRAA